MRVSFLLNLGYRKIRASRGREKKVRCHYLRDWSGTEVPAYLIFPPIDQMTAAAYVSGLGHEAQIVDGNIGDLSHDELAQKGSKFEPDWVILSSGWESQQSDLDFAHRVKEVRPSCKIAMSGPNATHDPGPILNGDSPVDVVVLGELEGGLRGILAGDLDDNCAYRVNGGNTVRGRRTLIEDLDSLPFPARDLVPNEKYRLPFARKNPVTSLISSRGCPHGKCSFCVGNLYSQGRVRYRSADNVLGELEEIRFRYNIPEVMFRDQCFGGDRGIAELICEGMIKRNLGLFWRASMRVDLVDRDFLLLMRRAGCHSISFGFESPFQEVLDRNNKGITIKQSIHAARWAREAGMETSGGFMLALNGDRPDAYKGILRFALELKIDYPQFNITTVFPSTEISSRVEVSDTPDSRYGYGCPFNDSQADGPTLRRQLFWLYFRFYFRIGYILGRIRKIRSPDDALRLLRTAWAVFIYPIYYGKGM